jgi:hypothetical protein
MVITSAGLVIAGAWEKKRKFVFADAEKKVGFAR